MERDLYAVVRRDRARRRDWRFYAVLGLVLALAAATLLPMAWSIRYQLRYREFVEVLSESTLDSYRTGRRCLSAAAAGTRSILWRRG